MANLKLLDELTALLEAGTDGPWTTDVMNQYVWEGAPEEGDMVAEIRGVGSGRPGPEMDANAALIVAAVNNLPKLIEAIRVQREALDSVRLACQCDRSNTGFDYGEDHPTKGKAAPGKRWLTPDEVALAAIERADRIMEGEG